MPSHAVSAPALSLPSAASRLAPLSRFPFQTNQLHQLMKAIILASLATALPLAAAITSPGDLMFTGYNADGTDDLAFVLLADYDSGTAVHFTDNEWNGTGWTDRNESFFTWQSDVSLPAGTVISLSFIGSGTLSATQGSAVFAESTGRGLGASNESVYAFLGSTYDTATPVFLSAIANSGFVSVATGTLTGTGLAAGSNATSFTSGADVLAYAGDRTGQTSFDAYRGLLADTATWITEDGAGDQHNNGIAPDVPFATDSFGVVPEPAAAGLALLGLVPVIRRRRSAII